jgi:hypothetical protein
MLCCPILETVGANRETSNAVSHRRPAARYWLLVASQGTHDSHDKTGINSAHGIHIPGHAQRKARLSALVQPDPPVFLRATECRDFAAAGILNFSRHLGKRLSQFRVGMGPERAWNCG